MKPRRFAARLSARLHRAVCETLEQRCLLASPVVTAKWFDHMTAATYTTRPHTVGFQFNEDVWASHGNWDMRLEAVTGDEPDPIATAATGTRQATPPPSQSSLRAALAGWPTATIAPRSPGTA